jgi:GNAT superfamily N-acetyltransferase
MFYSFSEQTKYLRYHGILKSMPHHRLQVLCNVDYNTEMALVAVLGATGQEEIIGVGRYVTTPAKESAEIALVVRDDWQRKGIGTYLLKRLVGIGKQDAIHKFIGYVLPENTGMLTTVHHSGFNTETATEDGVVRVTVTVDD